MIPVAPVLKPKLLIVELWGLGDLVIATPFLRAAAERFDITLLAKPFALDLQPRLWPEVKVVTLHRPVDRVQKQIPSLALAVAGNCPAAPASWPPNILIPASPRAGTRATICC